ncbi:hypothetical protein FRX31_018272, partial [Thalictrum thalictroides]
MPLWMCFSGLELEHHSTEIIKMIASAAGFVNEVLPVGIIPRSAEGYRARVSVFVNLPLVEGTMVNSLTKGNVWITFKCNGLPSLYCNTCRRLGHDRHICAITNQKELLQIGYYEEVQSENHGTPAMQVQNQEIGMEDCNWPHEIQTQQSPTAELGQSSGITKKPNYSKNLQQDSGPEMKTTRLVNLWAETGLISTEELESLGLQQRPMARRRGRPPGSTNKKPKPTNPIKNNSPIAAKTCASKKRKLMESIDENNEVIISYNPNPPTVQHNTSLRGEPSPFSIDFIRQILQHPESAALLAQDGILNPEFMSLLPNIPNENENSPHSIFQGPYSAASDDEIKDDNVNLIDIIEVETVDLENVYTGNVTIDPSGGSEQRNNLTRTGGLISISLPKSPMLNSTSSINHNE